MIRAGLIGVGKMGISHYAILGAHRDIEMAAICDSATYVTSALRKHTGVESFKDYRKMIEAAKLDCVFVATPSSSHFEAATYALEQGLHVFVEKPLCLDPSESKRLADLAREESAPIKSATTIDSSARFRKPSGWSRPELSATSIMSTERPSGRWWFGPRAAAPGGRRSRRGEAAFTTTPHMWST